LATPSKEFGMCSVRESEGGVVRARQSAKNRLDNENSSLEAFAPDRILRVNLANGAKVLFIRAGLLGSIWGLSIHVASETVRLTGTEYNLLKVLVLSAGRLLTQGRLTKEIWGEKRDDDARQLLRTTIRSLRQKLDTNSSQPGHFATEPGVGYRLRVTPPE